MLACISIIIFIFGLEHALSACTGHVPHMHFIITSLFNGTLPSSFLPNKFKQSLPAKQQLHHSLREISIKKYVTATPQQQNRRTSKSTCLKSYLRRPQPTLSTKDDHAQFVSFK